MAVDPRQRRRYLFLQGMATAFFAELGAALAKHDHTVKRINFNAGDRLFWRLPGSVSYRGTLADWPRALENYLSEWRITDVVLFGDWRPFHIEAIRIARLRGLLVHVFEEGYLRPSWITLEQGGVNKNSSLPRDPGWYRRVARSLPSWQDRAPVTGSFWVRALNDVIYHSWSGIFAWRYPHFRTHLPVAPFLEYACWIRRFIRASSVRRRSEEALRELSSSGKPYFLVPLQLDSDSQLRVNSRFQGLAQAIDVILESFARHAPRDSALLLKEHPLDNQLIDWRAQATGTARRLGIGDRVFYLVGGDTRALIEQSRGVVTVNSTAGLLAVLLGRPVKTLARPIYDMTGLTFQPHLDHFWREGTAPDTALVDDFRRVVVDRTQINGDFFSAEGLKLAVAGAMSRLEAAALQHPVTRAAPLPSAMPLLSGDAVPAQSGAD
jgi:capsular polysaccharide export protein